jgi:hypothetical protein
VADLAMKSKMKGKMIKKINITTALIICCCDFGNGKIEAKTLTLLTKEDQKIEPMITPMLVM